MCINTELEKDNWDATNSWSGYNYQGKIALFVVLKKINELISMGKMDEIEKYCVELEWLEDFSILYKGDDGVQYKTIHQVKAKDKHNITDYEDALVKLYYKIVNYKTIEYAYLHVCKSINYIEDEWNDNVKGMLTNEKYKGDFHIQKTYIPEGTHQSVKNNGQVQSYYVTEDHPAIISAEEWQQVQELMEYHRKQRNIGKGEKYQKRYPMSGMLVCPYCGKSLRRRYVYNRKVEWLCATYIHKGKEACKGIRIRDTELAGLSFSEPMVVEEVMIDGEKHYGYTSKRAYDAGERAADRIEKESRSVLPRINRPRRTVIKL